MLGISSHLLVHVSLNLSLLCELSYLCKLCWSCFSCRYLKPPVKQPTEINMDMVEKQLQDRIKMNAKDFIKAFHLFDYNRDGRIQRHDFRKVLDNNGLKLNESQFEKWVFSNGLTGVSCIKMEVYSSIGSSNWSIFCKKLIFLKNAVRCHLLEINLCSLNYFTILLCCIVG